MTERIRRLGQYSAKLFADYDAKPRSADGRRVLRVRKAQPGHRGPKEILDHED